MGVCEIEQLFSSSGGSTFSVAVGIVARLMLQTHWILHIQSDRLNLKFFRAQKIVIILTF
jgi:hypothetical protein